MNLKNNQSGASKMEQWAKGLAAQVWWPGFDLYNTCRASTLQIVLWLPHSPWHALSLHPAPHKRINKIPKIKKKLKNSTDKLIKELKSSRQGRNRQIHCNRQGKDRKQSKTQKKKRYNVSYKTLEKVQQTDGSEGEKPDNEGKNKLGCPALINRKLCMTTKLITKYTPRPAIKTRKNSNAETALQQLEWTETVYKMAPGWEQTPHRPLLNLEELECLAVALRSHPSSKRKS